MKMPNAENAVVPEEKITRYLLDPEHPQGAGKAKFFITCGFTVESWEVMQQAFLQHAMDCELAGEPVVDRFGVSYILEGRMRMPDASSPFVRTVWKILRGQQFPRLVTAHPREKGRLL